MTDYKYEEEETWKLAREMAWEVYGLTSRGAFESDHRMRNNIRRASFSVMANVAEGFERGGTLEFCRYLGNARDEITDLREQLSIAVKQGYLKQESLKRTEDMLKQLGCMISGLLLTLNQAFVDVDFVSGHY